MKPESTPTNVILAVIRGELPLSTLSEVGVLVEFTEQSCEVETETSLVVTPSANDIVCGLIAHKEHPHDLKQWASFVMAASQLVDFDKLELHEDCDRLIDALWDASFQGKFDRSTIPSMLVETRAIA